MNVLPPDAKKICIPKLYSVKQLFSNEKIDDIEETVCLLLSDEKIRNAVKPGSSVALLVGSRGIASINDIVKATVKSITSLGATPMIIPAMGSHGGGIAEEQTKILEGYGVTEEYTGAKIYSSMDTEIIGTTSQGIPIHIDKIASSADVIIPIARIKPHTDFEAAIESGLCKMLAIGLGKHKGCSRLHQEGFLCFPKLIPEVASIIIDKKNIPFGIALIENAHEHLHTIQIVPGENFLSEEPGLLAFSKSIMPRLQFDEIDVLIVEQIGKNISGAGMDPNITGRMPVGNMNEYSGPSIKRIVVLGLTSASHGNATGMGIADFTVKSMFEKVDLNATYTNGIASGTPEASKIPLMLDGEEEAIRAAIQTSAGIDINNPKIVRIENTLHIIDIKVSQALLEYCKLNPEKFMVIE